MDNFDATDSNSINLSGNPAEPPIEELSHTDKMTGIFSEPSSTYEATAKFPPRTIDWFLPVALLLLLVFLSQVLMMSNEEIAYKIKHDRMQKIEQQFDKAVQEGKMTREQANQTMERIEGQFDMSKSAVGKIIQFVSIFIIGFIFFFLVAAIYFVFAKFVFKDEGSYKSAMVASGLTSYITMIQIIVAAILALAFGKLMSDTSVASFMGIEKSTFMGYLLAKLDPISIWAYIVLGIGLAKMFKSKSNAKYYFLVFGLWIIGSLIFFGLGKAFPFLQNFGG